MKTIQSTIFIALATAVVIAGIYCVVPANGVDSSLMYDVQRMRKAEAATPYYAPKDKKAQEEVVFGNQQNKLTDNRSFGRPAKRAFPIQVTQNEADEDDDDSGPNEPIALPLVYQPKFHRNTYYYDPNLYGVPFIEETRGKLNINNQRQKRLEKRETRTKRELQVDPQELLTLLALWEAERNRKQQPVEIKSYPYAEYVPRNDEENDIEEDYSNDAGLWLDGQTEPVHRIKPRYYPPYHWTPTANQQAKRYLKEIMMKRNLNKEE